MASFIAPNYPNFGAPGGVLKSLPAHHLARLPRLPDLLTTANLACGVLSILLASQGQLTIACGLIFLAAVFDVFDGLAARALGGGSPLGAQLDSLADMVSFGVAPGMLVWFWAQPWLEIGSIANAATIYPPLGRLPDATAFSQDASVHPPGYWILLAAVLWIPLASAWRLAKFNIDTRQSSGFLGLPTPANALFWASIVLAFKSGKLIGSDWPMGIGGSHPAAPLFRLDLGAFAYWMPFVVAGVSLFLGILMLSELPLPSLKFKHKGWKGNEVIFLLIGIGVVLAALYGVLAVPLILVLYLLSPLWGKLFSKAQ